MAFDAYEFLRYFGYKRIKNQDEENVMASCHNEENHTNADRKRSFGMLKKGVWRRDVTGKLHWVPAGTANCYVCGGWSLEQLTAELLTRQDAALSPNPRKYTEYDAILFLQSKGWLPDEPEVTVEQVEEQLKTIEEPVVQSRTYPEDILLPYLKQLHRSALKRGSTANAISVEVARDWKLGYDASTRRTVIPVYSEEQKLVGVISRAVDENDPIRYGVGTVNPEWRQAQAEGRWFTGDRMLYVFDKGQYVFGENRWNPEHNAILLLESPLDVIYAWSCGLHEHINLGAVFGSKVTRSQLRKIMRHKCVIEALDNDEGGREGREKLKRDLMGRVDLYTFDHWGKKDLGECTPEEVMSSPERFKPVIDDMFSGIEEMV